MDLCREWEDDRGGFKVKWRDDTSAWIVFGDAAVGEQHLSFKLSEGCARRRNSSISVGTTRTERGDLREDMIDCVRKAGEES